MEQKKGITVYCATIGCIGRLPAPGTVASALTYLVLVFTKQYTSIHTMIFICCAVLLSIFAIFIINRALPAFSGTDPQSIVLDEVVGACYPFFVAYHSWHFIVASFLLFRFFDITKIGGIKWVERLPRGIGIVGDDIVAGLYTLFIIAGMQWWFVT